MENKSSKEAYLKEIKRLVLVIAGGVLLALNINTFVNSASLIPGGFSGLALLIQSIFKKYFNLNLPFSLLVYAFNIFPVYIGFRYIGKKFTIYSVVMIVVSGLLTDVLPTIPITNDILLCSIFGGFINAVAIYLCLNADSSSGGTDFISIYISEKTGKSAWNFILAGNIVVLIAAGFLISWNSALYSIIFQYVSTQALNLLYKKYAKTTLLIITDNPEPVYQVIKEKTNHAATIFQGKGCYKDEGRKLVYSVVSSSESGMLEKLIRQADPDAFINVLQSKEIIGKFFKRNVD